ncbi:alanine--tRNA ligase [bacterium]|nr:alanine--tRNA ligase [bacterium]
MKSSLIRQKFFDYFKKLGHEHVSSSSLIPAQDPTLLFTNAGMNQFKDCFLGLEKRSYDKAVTIQKCVRAGGKHNDLDNVGFTKRHLTFFEMMGNFSFGSYFKEQAIPYAWNFLLDELKLDPQDLCVTVHHTDDEAYDIWTKKIGIPQHKIFRMGADNFWQMGDVGPCGPCTEIYVDKQAREPQANPKDTPETNDTRFLEIWNVVFMQYDRQPDGTDVLLKQSGVDTGAGFERIACVMQGKDTVYETDIFAPIIAQIEHLTGKNYAASDAQTKAAFNVLADHIRSTSFLISDGCAPSNEGRGYVLRKIIRRAALFAQKLSTKENIFPKLVDSLVESVKEVYPDLATNKERVKSVLSVEVERFAENLSRGQVILEDYFKQSQNNILSGQHAFTLYDTYGFPFEVTELICRERGYTVSRTEFEEYMEKQRMQSGKKMKQTTKAFTLPEDVVTEFTGYSSLQEQSEITALIQDDQLVQLVQGGQIVWVVAQKTPFYVECGGQVNDEGFVEIHGKQTPLLDLQKIGNAIAMKIVAPVSLALHDFITMRVDEFVRLHTMKNHTATHLLQAALQKKFGKQVKQAGSVVNKDLLRFDFTYHKPLALSEITEIENEVNTQIWKNIPVDISHTTYKKAVDAGVIAFFGEKYNQDNVRVVTISDVSAELCGGTHVRATGDIGCFKIVEETALAAGQRRMVALTGVKALETYQQNFAIVKQLGQDLKTKPESLLSAVEQLKTNAKELERLVKQLQKEKLVSQIPHMLDRTLMLHGMPFGYFTVQDCAIDLVRDALALMQQKKQGFYFVVCKQGNTSMFVAQVGNNFAQKINMQNFKSWLEKEYGVKGGGSATMLQGGLPEKRDEHFEQAIVSWINEQ